MRAITIYNTDAQSGRARTLSKSRANAEMSPQIFVAWASAKIRHQRQPITLGHANRQDGGKRVIVAGFESFMPINRQPASR
jgi:hypothetical protein